MRSYLGVTTVQRTLPQRPATPTLNKGGKFLRKTVMLREWESITGLFSIIN